MTALGWLFDGLIGLMLLGLVWRALESDNLYSAVIHFISFGLVMALAWVRLSAPDIALAEAAIGAGLTGILLLDAASQVGGKITLKWKGGAHGAAGEVERP